MPESFMRFTEGSGKNAHTYQRNIGGTNVEDEVVLQGLPYFPTYSYIFTSASLTGSGTHLVEVMAGASLNLYIVRVQVWQATVATSANFVQLSLKRLTSAGTGGTVISAQAHDTTDPAANSTGMQLPTVAGVESLTPYRASNFVAQTPTAVLVPLLDWEPGDNGFWKPIRVPTGVANGFAIRNDTAVAGATVSGTVTVIELPY